MLRKEKTMITINIKDSKKTRTEWALFITFDYDVNVLNTIKNVCPVRYWDATNKSWEVPFNKLGELVDSLGNYEITINANADMFKTTKPVEYSYEYKTKPFGHQIDGFNYGMSHNAWLLGDEQGLGKTKQVIDIAVAKKYTYGYKHCLIICGVNGLKWNWLNEIAVHSNESGYIIGSKVKKNGKLTVGSVTDRLNDLNNIDNIKDYFLITNVETLRDTQISKKISELCKKHIIGIVAVDEIHRCKNPVSQQGKGLLNITADDMIAMTGTPIMNNPLDMYIILKWLGYDNHSFYAFKNYYCNMGGFGGYEIVGYKHLDQLKEQIDSFMLRRRKEDVLDLPEKIYINEYVDMSAKQAQVYGEVLNGIKENIDLIKVAPNPLAQLIRLRQATGYTGILSSDVAESAKLDRMVELVEDTVANGKKVVIFSNWTQMTDVIFNRVQQYGTELITGETRDEDRQSAVERFQNDPNCKVIVGTIGAMGTGLTLTAGTVEIFLDEPWTMAAKDQAVDRCHRIGATQNVTVYTLLTKNTIDERINELVKAKGDIASALVDGKMDKSDMLDYLLS